MPDPRPVEHNVVELIDIILHEDALLREALGKGDHWLAMSNQVAIAELAWSARRMLCGGND